MISKLKGKVTTCLGLVVILVLYYRLRKLDKPTVAISDYASTCLDLYQSLRYPAKNMVIRPPPRKPPEAMIREFEQYGDMPITKYVYYNDQYNDAAADSGANITSIIKKTEIETLLARIKADKPLGYSNTELKKTMYKYKQAIRKKSVTVVGTQYPWIESIAVSLKAKYILTLDYTRKKYEQLTKDIVLDWMHVNDFLEKGDLEQFDAAVSFSSIEHAGLGRYGDPLSPFGDLEALKQMHCMLKKDGLLFLGLPTSIDNSSYIEFNAHRIYGTKRLNLLFDKKKWKLLEQQKCKGDYYSIFVLRKIQEKKEKES